MQPLAFERKQIVNARAGLAEFVRGWRIVAGSLLGIAIGVSSIYFYSLGIFLKPIAAEYGWGRGAASLGALIGTAASALVAIPVGRLVDRIGSVKVAVVSMLLLALGFLALGAFTFNLTSFLILTAMLSVFSAGSTPLPYTRLVIAGFDRSRGLALGVILAGTGIGALVIPVLLAPYVAKHGWRAGYFALAAVVALLLPVVWWLILSARRYEPSKREASIAFLTLTGSTVFRLLALIFFLASTAILGTLVHFVPMLTDWGLSPARAGATAGVVGATAIGARLLVGYALDRAPPLLVTAGVCLSVAGGLILLGFRGPTLAVGGAIAIGLGIGAEVDLIAFLVGRFFSKASYGQTYGALYAVFLMGAAIGPGISGYLQQATGNYEMSLYGAAALLVLASTFALLLQRISVKPALHAVAP